MPTVIACKYAKCFDQPKLRQSIPDRYETIFVTKTTYILQIPRVIWFKTKFLSRCGSGASVAKTHFLLFGIQVETGPLLFKNIGRAYVCLN